MGPLWYINQVIMTIVGTTRHHHIMAIHHLLIIRVILVTTTTLIPTSTPTSRIQDNPKGEMVDNMVDTTILLLITLITLSKDSLCNFLEHFLSKTIFLR